MKPSYASAVVSFIRQDSYYAGEKETKEDSK